MLSSKHWNDRADKDLFFTILSVKNIGLISGGEWTTIGNHMRSMGYGFTNEGCRQHFQGLRRAQNKAEANGTPPAHARERDPTLNPITRRPGPGRGRPRKRSAEDDSPIDSLNTMVSEQIPDTPPLSETSHKNASLALQQDQQHVQQLEQQLDKPDSAVLQTSEQPILASETLAVPETRSIDSTAASQPMKGAGKEDADAEDSEEPPVKRIKLETRHIEQEEQLDDEAVLALAAHHEATGPDHYGEEFNYGGA